MSSLPTRRTIPIGLGVAMLAVIVAASLAPNTGAVSAASNCTYGQCPSSSSSIPVWELATIGAVVVLAAILGLFVLMRRRRRPPEPGAMGPAEGGPVPPAGAGEIEGVPGVPPGGGETAASYVETPEDVGRAPPTLAPEATAAGAGAAGTEAEPDIDSLMAELDKISGEILKRTPKKGADQPPSEEGESTDTS